MRPGAPAQHTRQAALWFRSFTQKRGTMLRGLAWCTGRVATRMSVDELLALRLGQATVSYCVQGNKVNVSGEFHQAVKARIAETAGASSLCASRPVACGTASTALRLRPSWGFTSLPVTDDLAESAASARSASWSRSPGLSSSPGRCRKDPLSLTTWMYFPLLDGFIP